VQILDCLTQTYYIKAQVHTPPATLTPTAAHPTDLPTRALPVLLAAGGALVELPVELALVEVEILFCEKVPPWTIGGATLVLVFFAAAWYATRVFGLLLPGGLMTIAMPDWQWENTVWAQ
jgi:hypothetical protein